MTWRKFVKEQNFSSEDYYDKLLDRYMVEFDEDDDIELQEEGDDDEGDCRASYLGSYSKQG
jgi:hypothetical protein